MPKNGSVKITQTSYHYRSVVAEMAEWKQTEQYRQWYDRQMKWQFGLCYYCERYLKDLIVNVEHIKPKTTARTNNVRNLVLSCAGCNKAKRWKPLSQKQRKGFKARMMMRHQGIV
jgi:uncharacterized protein (TIGR02646 family)